MNGRKVKFEKAVMSVSEISAMLGISRSRFYQCLAANVFPQPLYDIRTHRPFYTLELQNKCLEIKQSGIGYNMQYVLFYSPRKNKGTGTKSSVPKKTSQYQDLIEALAQMGLEVSDEQVTKAIIDVFPEGIENRDQGIVIRELFRFFKKGL
jgi:hypothetical protein